MRNGLIGLLALLFLAAPASASDQVSSRLRGILRILTGERTSFGITIHITTKDEKGTFVVYRDGDEEFRLEFRHPKYGFTLKRAPEQTILAVERHRRQYVGKGTVAEADSLRPEGMALRILSADSRLRAWWQSLVAFRGLDRMNEEVAAELLQGLIAVNGEKLEFHAWESSDDLSITVGDVTIRYCPIAPPPPRRKLDGPIHACMEVDRAELERTILRGLRRAGEVLLPTAALTGREPFRIVTLTGTPEEIGTKHGKLLAAEARRAIDSTLHLTGLAYTIDRGEWFPSVLRTAWKRLAPHIPSDHHAEMDALADAAGIDRETVRLSNVFPELFHCSGFAVFGKATKGGKLYHGRVLDYMTMIGLQDAATVFVVKPKGKHAFVNVGYAGFVGSVTGMNEKKLSLGEMGGRGEGKWDGVPMATLMRRALEECGTLDEAIDLWRKSPRTCEYYYVVADGKIPDAVAVSATPDKFEVLRAGADHDRLGKGIPDAVVLSAGGRLDELRRRILAGHGKIDAEAAIRLMSRPVAMKSNLHNALFVPQDLVLWIAHADRERPAAECEYTKIDFATLLSEFAD